MFGIGSFPSLKEGEPVAWVDATYLESALDKREYHIDRGHLRACVSRRDTKHPWDMYHDSFRAHLPRTLRLGETVREFVWRVASLHTYMLTGVKNPTLGQPGCIDDFSTPVTFSDADPNAQRFACEDDKGNVNWWWSGPLSQGIGNLGLYDAQHYEAFVGLLSRLVPDDHAVDRCIAEWVRDELPFPPIGQCRHGHEHVGPADMHGAAMRALREPVCCGDTQELERFTSAPLADSDACSVRSWEERLTTWSNGAIVRFTREPIGTEIADGVRLVTAGDSPVRDSELVTTLDDSDSESDSDSHSESDSGSDSGSSYSSDNESGEDDAPDSIALYYEAEDVQEAIRAPAIGTFTVLALLGKIKDPRVDALLRVKLGERDAKAWRKVARDYAAIPYMFSSAVATWIQHGPLMTRALRAVAEAARDWFPTPAPDARNLTHVVRWAAVGQDADWSKHAGVLASANADERVVVVLGAGTGAGLETAKRVVAFQPEFQRIVALCRNVPHAVVVPFSWHGATCQSIDRAATVIFDADCIEQAVSTCHCTPDNGLPKLCDKYEHEMWSPCRPCAGPFTQPDVDACVHGLQRYTVPLEH